MRFVKYMTAPILMAALCSFWGCDKDEDHLSEAVLASASTLNFEVERAAEKTITVYADADWVTEVPDWVTVTPDSGTGVTDVTISVTDNMRGGAEDNPRKAALVFKGRTLASRAEVLITQDGDKYRDVKEYTAGELAALADETIISVPSAIVVAVTTKGFVISDDRNTDNIFVSDATTVAVGDKISFLGTKSSDSQKLAMVIDCDEVTVLSSGTVTYPTPTDITATIDTYTSNKRTYVTVSGFFNGSTVSVSETAKYSINLVDAPASLGLSALTGHNVIVTGYYAGLAEPVQRIMVAGVEDKGIVEVIYFSDDFEWMDTWSEKSDAGDTVGKGVDDKARNVYSYASLGEPFLADLTEHGYTLVCMPSSTTSTYLQKNYLKFGRTDVQAGLVLPSMEIPANTKAKIAFDWAPHIGTSFKFDPVKIIVEITNGEHVVELDPVGHNFEDTVDKLTWLHAELPLDGITVNKDTKITIRSDGWGETSATTGSKVYKRWYIDNIKVSNAD